MTPSATPPTKRRVAIMGSSGSIGTQTLQVIEHLNALFDQGAHPTRYEVVALATGSNAPVLAGQARAHPDAALALCDPSADPAPLSGRSYLQGPDSSTRIIEQTEPDLVVAAIVGIAGLPSTLLAAQRGIDIALANKESLVAAGDLVTSACVRSGATLLPVDSEHAALHQCLLALTAPTMTPPLPGLPSVARATLTASGGALRGLSDTDYERATPEQALAHPTWDMGAKVTIDCATLVNKGLELIEAHHLFGLRADQLGAVIHPQSIIHALVETTDASVLAQLAPTDMRIPIQHALTHPLRAPAATGALDLAALGSLELRPVDTVRHRAVPLALRAIEQGGTTGTVLNAANEAAVGAFLDHRIPLGRIAPTIESVMDAIEPGGAESLEHILETDARARAAAQQIIEQTPERRA